MQHRLNNDNTPEVELLDSEEYERLALEELSTTPDTPEEQMIRAVRAQAYATLALAAVTREVAPELEVEDEEEEPDFDDEEEEEEDEEERPPRRR